MINVLFLRVSQIMDSRIIKQNAVYIAAALVALLIIYVIAPTQNYTPRGIILPTIKTPLIPSTNPVQIYQNAPYTSTQIADVNLEMHSLKPTKTQEHEMLTAAKKMAQKAGADGLVITMFGYEGASANNPSVLAKYVLQAKAIKLN